MNLSSWNLSAGEFNGVITILLMVAFIGIWIWAWRKRHKKVFDRMAALPMEDDMDKATKTQDIKENNHD